MCGFVGIADFDGSINLERAKQAQKLIEHRGPDAQDSWTDGSNIFLGHNRLSIIDLSNEANQPFTSSHSDAKIVYNGEVSGRKDFFHEWATFEGDKRALNNKYKYLVKQKDKFAPSEDSLLMSIAKNVSKKFAKRISNHYSR